MLRLILSPRWIMWHLLTLGAMATCGWLALWQWQRAGSAMGSALNVGYGLQWPLFALFFAVMWWRLLWMEIKQLRGAEEAPAGTAQALAPAPEPEPSAVVPQPRAVPGGPSPFGPRPATVSPAAVDEDDREGRELAAYNRMLKQLAAQNSDD